MKHILFCSMLLLLQRVAQAQPYANVSTVSYNTENGLPSNGIKGLEFDEATGFLWIATEAGVTRFNGISFYQPPSLHPASAGPKRMVMMVRNNAGEIITADEAGYVFTISSNQMYQWPTAAELKGKTNKLFYLAVSKPFYMAMDARPNPFMLEKHRVLPAGDTACWVLNDNLLYYVTAGAIREVPVRFSGAKRLFKTGTFCFMAAEGAGVFLLTPEAISPVPLTDAGGSTITLNNKQNTIFWQNGMENPVLISGTAASLLHYNGGVITTAPLVNNLPAGTLVRHVQYSRKNKTLFIGTDSRGVFMIRANSVSVIRPSRQQGRDRNAYYSQVAMPGNRVITNEGHILDEKGTAVNSTAPPVKGGFSVWIYRAGDTALWYFKGVPRLSRNCLHRYSYRTGATAVYPEIQGIDGGAITGSGGRIYIANRRGIGVLAGDSLQYPVSYPGIHVSNTAFDIKEISTGVLAIATCRGLFRYQTAKGVLDTVISAGSICFRSIWQYNGYVFLGTYGGGYYIWKGDRIKAMPLDKNKYLQYAHCFMPDRKGYCWISTNRGLFKVRISDMIQAFENNLPQVYYHYYGKNDGMDITEMNGGCSPCALELENKTLSFPTMDGLLWTSPEDTLLTLPAGGIYTDEITVDGAVMPPGEFTGKTLPARTGEIVVRTAFSGWCNQENIYLEYRLNGKGPWLPVNAAGGSAITLSNLRPGSYLLQIKKLNGFGTDNFTVKEIPFSINTPWYQRWWFYLLAAMALGGVFMLFLRLRTRQLKAARNRLERQVQEKTRELLEKNEALEKNNAIKTRLISIISHDIITPLKFLSVAGKNLLEKRKIMAEALQDETIREMTGTARELQQLSTNILNWIKYQNENRRLVKEQFEVRELVNQVLGVLRSMANQKGLRLENRVAEGEMIFQYFEPLKILVYNLVANAVNFSEKGTVTISMLRSGTGVTISVADEGVGMTPAQIDNIMAGEFIVSSANMDNRKGNGLGYLIIKDLMKTMGGSLRIRSAAGKGVTVEVDMPATA